MHTFNIFCIDASGFPLDNHAGNDDNKPCVVAIDSSKGVHVLKKIIKSIYIFTSASISHPVLSLVGPSFEAVGQRCDVALHPQPPELMRTQHSGGVLL